MDCMQTDFPVPLSPKINTPPILGSTAFNNNDNFMSSCPTIRAKGNSKDSISDAADGTCDRLLLGLITEFKSLGDLVCGARAMESEREWQAAMLD
mmetsp:Transcript_25003/g.34803  ORF Transcript_25003/g.34803 Transcript_25003/m.34803 type:complete len:95 (-) Transcript_25003:124-408(-)